LHIEDQIHSFHETEAALSIVRAARCPVVVTLHEFHTELASARITRELARRASFVAASDRRTADRCSSAVGRSVDSIFWSPTNVLPSAASRATPKRRGLVVTFGQINAIKSFAPLADALRALRPRRPDLRWRLVGPFEPRSNPEHAQLSKDLGDDWIEFTGGFERLDDPALLRALSEAEIMALPFADGASPRRTSLQTAWAFGLPVVTTRPPSAEPKLLHERNALLVRNEPRDWAEAIGRLLDEEALRARLSEGALDAARDFGWERLVAVHLACYEALLSRPCATREARM
jgi:glycosyltransferase involved in cell wall biosynthesis